ncbi:MAG: CHAT domain-containing protein [Caldilineaceae bacterium]
MSDRQHFTDLEIRIFKCEDQGYPVELTLNREQEYKRGYLAADILSWVPTGDAIRDGEDLFRRLFSHEQLKLAWVAARNSHAWRRVRLRIDDDAPELHVIPWELLRDDEGREIAASADMPFSRYLAKPSQLGVPIFQRPIRMLVAIAAPDNLQNYHLSPIDVDGEWDALQAAVAELDVELCRMPHPCTLAALEAECRGNYHILHLISHGRFDEKSQTAALFLCDNEGAVALCTETDMAGMLSRQLGTAETGAVDRLRLVFFAACQSASRSPVDPFRGLAPRLVDAGIPAVVAMQDLVSVGAARTFVATFYRQLLTHGQVDLASNEARATLLTQKIPGAHIPVLFLRQREGRLLDQQGELAGGGENFWPFLLRKIYEDSCIPLLGPGVNQGLLPTSDEMSKRLAEQYGYPLADNHNLARVAQFMLVNGNKADLTRNYLAELRRALFAGLGEEEATPERRRGRGRGNQLKSLSAQIAELQWAKRVFALEEDPIHHLLADIQFPLYITTTIDSFLEEALRYQQERLIATGERTATSIRSFGPRWDAVAGAPKYHMDPKATWEAPVVFHLNGREDEGESEPRLILTEDDHLHHFARISYEQEILLPSDLLGQVAESTFMLIGFRLDDWEFREVLHGLLRYIAQSDSGRRRHIGVQLAPAEVPNRDGAQSYLRDYLREFDINIYWGEPKQFVRELHSRWQEYLKEQESL